VSRLLVFDDDDELELPHAAAARATQAQTATAVTVRNDLFIRSLSSGAAVRDAWECSCWSVSWSLRLRD